MVCQGMIMMISVRIDGLLQQMNNKYQILQVIDEGAYGIVLKALNKDTGKYVAIKKFKQGDEDQTVRKNIQREIKMLKHLKSDYVVDLKQAFKKKGKVYLIFEYMQRNVLNLIEHHENGLPPQMIAHLIYQLFRALRFLHAKNIIHRDIKPQNLLVNSDNKLKLCDFGFTRNTPSPQEDLTDYVATRWYRPPELLVGERYGTAMDVWAAGCIMGELIDGQPMFPGENQMDQLYLIKKTFGELTPSQIETFSKNQRFIGLIFPQIRKLETIESRYIGKLSKNGTNFLRACLKLDPNQRISAADALNHPYLLPLHLKNNERYADEDQIKFGEKRSKTRLNELPREQHPQLTSIKTIYDTKSRGFFPENKHSKLFKSPRNTKQLFFKQDSKKIDFKQSNGQKSHDVAFNMHLKVNVNVNGGDSLKNLPHIKSKDKHRLLHTKANSQPLMLHQTKRFDDKKYVLNPGIYLGVTGESKSILRTKK